MNMYACIIHVCLYNYMYVDMYHVCIYVYIYILCKRLV